MSAFPSSLSRRRFLTANTTAASDLLLVGCCHRGMGIFKSGTLATPSGVPANSPLTIDVHRYIFNGTDLQIRQFSNRYLDLFVKNEHRAGDTHTGEGQLSFSRTTKPCAGIMGLMKPPDEGIAAP